LGHKVNIFMPDWMSEERKNIIRALGANIRLVRKEEGDSWAALKWPTWQQKPLMGFLPLQFSNQHNPDAHYHTTGPEIWCS